LRPLTIAHCRYEYAKEQINVLPLHKIKNVRTSNIKIFIRAYHTTIKSISFSWQLPSSLPVISFCNGFFFIGFFLAGAFLAGFFFAAAAFSFATAVFRSPSSF
jgi:hypothetical protein